jgi:ABC-type uncharacterized transport system permease subunit
VIAVSAEVYGGTIMGEFLFGLAEFLALIVFIVALVQGKGFWNAVRMGVGVLILGVVAVLVLGLLGFAFRLTMGLLTLALWGIVIYAIVVFLAKALRGAEM